MLTHHLRCTPQIAFNAVAGSIQQQCAETFDLPGDLKKHLLQHRFEELHILKEILLKGDSVPENKIELEESCAQDESSENEINPNSEVSKIIESEELSIAVVGVENPENCFEHLI